MIAAQNPGQAPEELGGDAHVVRRSRAWIEEAVPVGHRGHDQGARLSEGVAQDGDEAERSILDGTHGAEGGVHEEDAAAPDAERAELIGHVFGGERTHSIALFAPILSTLEQSRAMWKELPCTRDPASAARCASR